MYKLLAISKLNQGSIYYAVVDEFAMVMAIVKVCRGHPYEVRVIDATFSEMEVVMEFIKEQERKHIL